MPLLLVHLQFQRPVLFHWQLQFSSCLTSVDAEQGRGLHLDFIHLFENFWFLDHFIHWQHHLGHEI